VKLDRRAVASMLLAVAGGLAVGLRGAREATATPLDCETDAVPFVYKGWYNDNGYVWFKNNSGKPVAVQVQGDQGPTPIAAGQVQSWPRKSGSQYQYWVYALSSGGQPVQPQSASGSAQTGVVYMINSPSSIGTPPLVPGSSDYSDLSSTLWAAFVGNDSGLSCES
jgi:hypothetical protein